jgi:hypothetical protein
LFYKDSKLVTDLIAEADQKGRGLYIGPQVRSLFKVSSCQFETLDLNLQEE